MVAATVEALHHVLSLALHSAKATVFVKSSSGLLGLGPCAIGLCAHLLRNMLSLLSFMEFGVQVRVIRWVVGEVLDKVIVMDQSSSS